MAGMSFGQAMDERLRLAQRKANVMEFNADTARMNVEKPDLTGMANSIGAATAASAQKNTEMAQLRQRAGYGMAPPTAVPAVTAPTLNTPTATPLLIADQVENDDPLRPRISRAKGGMVRDPNGHPQVDTVDAELADGEAVLNAGAAKILGEPKIAALNKQGLKAMGVHGMPSPYVEDGVLHAATGTLPYRAGAFVREAITDPRNYESDIGNSLNAVVAPYARTAMQFGRGLVGADVGVQPTTVDDFPVRLAAGRAKLAELGPVAYEYGGPKPAPQPQIVSVVEDKPQYATLPANASKEQRSNYNLAEQGAAGIVRLPGNVYTNVGAVNPYAKQVFKGGLQQKDATGAEIADWYKADAASKYADAYARNQAGERSMLATTKPEAYATMYHADKALEGAKVSAQDKEEASRLNAETRKYVADEANKAKRDTAKMWEPERDVAGNVIGFINKGTTERKPTLEYFANKLRLVHPEATEEEIAAAYAKKYGAK